MWTERYENNEMIYHEDGIILFASYWMYSVRTQKNNLFRQWNIPYFRVRLILRFFYIYDYSRWQTMRGNWVKKISSQKSEYITCLTTKGYYHMYKNSAGEDLRNDKLTKKCLSTTNFLRGIIPTRILVTHKNSHIKISIQKHLPHKYVCKILKLWNFSSFCTLPGEVDSKHLTRKLVSRPAS